MYACGTDGQPTAFLRVTSKTATSHVYTPGYLNGDKESPYTKNQQIRFI